MASNRWEGNSFRIPGLPVRPTYAAALTPPATALVSPAADALQQLGFRADDMGRGSGEIGQGAPKTQEASSFPDFLTKSIRGASMVASPAGFAFGLADIARNPQGKPGGYTWGDAAKALIPGGGLFDMLGGGDKALPGGGPAFGAYSGEQSFAEPDLSGFEASAPDVYGGEQGPAPFAKGGTVKARHLAGPNPPGPDDGLAYLDVGEEVVPKHAARKLRKTHGAGLFDMVRQGRLPAKR